MGSKGRSSEGQGREVRTRTGPRAQVSWHWYWGQWTHLGSNWAGGSTFTLMEQNGSELSLASGPAEP